MSKPIVLIHGAWHGGWCWEPVVAPLRARGHEVHAPDLPLTGLHEDAAALRDTLDRAGGASVLVGHSYGGMVINEAAHDRDDIDHLVFLCAFCPDSGEDLNDLYGRGEPVPLAAGLRVHDDHTVSVDPGVAPEAFYADCPAAAVEAALARLRPIGTRCMTTAAGGAAWRRIDSTYVVCTEDRAIHPTLQREMAERSRSVVSWDLSHSPFLSEPERVGVFLADLAVQGS